MITINTAKHPWVFSFSFFSVFFSLTLFLNHIKKPRDPPTSTRTQNYRYNKSSTGNTINNITYAKNKKEEKNNNKHSYLNLLKFGGEKKTNENKQGYTNR